MSDNRATDQTLSAEEERLSSVLRGLVDADHKAEAEWRKHFTLSLAIGNGAALLGFFNSLGDGPAAVQRLVLGSGWLFLTGLIIAAFCTKLAATEKARMSRLAHASAEWVAEGYAIGTPNHASVVVAHGDLQGLQRVQALLEWLGGTAFVIGVALALLAIPVI